MAVIWVFRYLAQSHGNHKPTLLPIYIVLRKSVHPLKIISSSHEYKIRKSVYVSISQKISAKIYIIVYAQTNTSKHE